MSRPRLGPHVRARRHLVGDAVKIVLSDARHDRRLLVGPREWRVLSAMDGTRDLEGITRASGQAPEVVAAFVSQVIALGLTDDPEAPVALASPARDLPVSALPGYAFTCTGAGACCAIADGVLFTSLEAARARAAAPDVLDAGHDEARAFLPEHGLDRALLAVTMRDGACAYLDDAGRCRVYDVRPHGCRTFPTWTVDVGDAIRVAPRVACACELGPGDAPLTTATRGADLPPERWVERLPARARLGDAEVSAGEALAWCDAIEWPTQGVLEHARGLADELGAAPIDPAALAEALRVAAAGHAFRAERDRLARALAWARDALARSEPVEVLDADEHLAARSRGFVGGLILGGDVGAGLRSLEARLHVARRFGAEARAEPWAAHPIAVVNAVARATGVW